MKVILCGPPDSGKTTLATALADHLAGFGLDVYVLHSDDFDRIDTDDLSRPAAEQRLNRAVLDRFDER